MSLLPTPLRPTGETRAITTAPWVEWAKGNDPFGASSHTGIRVNLETTMGVAAAWACATLLADMVSMLPLGEYTKTTDGRRLPTDPSPITVNPSNIYTRREWLFLAVVSAAIDGNIYGVTTERAGRQPSNVGLPTRVEVVDFSSMTVTQTSQIVRPTYAVGGQPVDRADVMHLRRYPRPGSAVGMSPLDLHTDLIGVAAAAREYAARWFGEGAHPDALLINDTNVTGDQAKIAKERWLTNRRSREPRVLGNGWKYQAVQGTPADSELIATWDRVGTQVCQMFRVPPEMIGIASGGSSITYANREQRSIDFLVFTMEAWLTMFEEWFTANLPERRFAKFNPDALLRVDTETRYRVHDMAIRMGKNTVNEIRRLEDEEPIGAAHGNTTLWPPYSVTVEEEQ